MSHIKYEEMSVLRRHIQEGEQLSEMVKRIIVKWNAHSPPPKFQLIDDARDSRTIITTSNYFSGCFRSDRTVKIHEKYEKKVSLIPELSKNSPDKKNWWRSIWRRYASTGFATW